MSCRRITSAWRIYDKRHSQFSIHTLQSAVAMCDERVNETEFDKAASVERGGGICRINVNEQSICYIRMKLSYKIKNTVRGIHL